MQKKEITLLFLMLFMVNSLFAMPTLDFDVQVGNQCSNPNVLTFTNKSKEIKKFTWTIKLGMQVLAIFYETTPPVYELTQVGEYTIMLKGENKNWEELISKDVVVKEMLAPLPNIVTPNGDGKNDTFITGRQGYKLNIYNRWGESIYQSASYKDDWPEHKIAEGTYFYTLTAPNNTKCTGTLTLIK